jgi:hypothetical protein
MNDSVLRLSCSSDRDVACIETSRAINMAHNFIGCRRSTMHERQNVDAAVFVALGHFTH